MSSDLAPMTPTDGAGDDTSPPPADVPSVLPAETDAPMAVATTVTATAPATTEAGPSLGERALRTFGRWALAFVAAFAIFAAFLITKGANPLDVYVAMWDTIAGSSQSFGELLVQTAPFMLAALAVAVPARAGLFNIGGEGQMLIGAIGAMLFANAMGNSLSPIMELTVMAIGGLAGGALWALGPALLKHFTATSEAITSLLLNYAAITLLLYLVNGPWKDSASLGFPQTRVLETDETFPIIWGRVHAGIVIPVIVAVIVWAVIKYTPWGFRLRVVGGNAEAARRAGFRVGAITMSAMLVGGALAGLAGMIEIAGVEGQLRPGIMVNYGYIGFLASWLVRHDPLKIIGSALLMGALAVSGTGLKSTAGLSGAAVYVLMALLLLAILGWSQKKKVAR